VYVWADGVYLQARMEDAAECMLVLIGATPEGKKELVASRRGCARARRAGVSFSSTSTSVVSRSHRTSRSAMGRSASGKRSSKSFPAPGIKGVGSISRAETRTSGGVGGPLPGKSLSAR
jgi:hypothetical protein